ncbi:MAG: sugar dehydrogenase [Pseudomonadales bacterium]|nr:sugar dehydrogenase [Pseudomonadales bacterium]
MKIALTTFITGMMVSLPLLAADSRPEPLADPIPEKIQKGDISVALQEFVQIPESQESALPERTNAAYARIQFMTPLPDGSGRLAVNDLRGLLYLVAEASGEPSMFLDVREYDIGFNDSMFPNETGLASVAFHPDYARQGEPGFGKFYTAISVSSDSGDADYLDDNAENHKSVIREWTAEDPSSNTFSGTTRELIRIGQFDQNHNIGTLAFNPAVNPGDADYGMLYASMGDGGGANDPMEYGQSTSEPMSSIFRIDPLGGEAGAAYGIPEDNPFVGNTEFAAETWAYGLRHPQAFSFDSDGTMYICDIGQTQIEEVNIGVPGANYGWRVREGTFATAFGIGGVRPNPVYPKPDDEEEFTYPVAQFDHDEGNAISSGFVYRGAAIPELQGKFVFTDMVTGRVFYIDTDNLEPGNPATILELRVEFFGFERNVADALGFPNTYSRGNRAGLRLGIDSAGELYFLTKGDGKIRKMVPVS